MPRRFAGNSEVAVGKGLLLVLLCPMLAYATTESILVNISYHHAAVVEVQAREALEQDCMVFRIETGREISLRIDGAAIGDKFLVILPRRIPKCFAIPRDPRLMMFVKDHESMLVTLSCDGFDPLAGFMQLRGIDLSEETDPRTFMGCQTSKGVDRQDALGFVYRVWLGANKDVMAGSGLAPLSQD